MTNIEKKLEALTFVRWDRFIETSEEIYFYGWIDREKDSYKDFLLVVFNKITLNCWWISSSVGRENEIDAHLGRKTEFRIACQRVEHKFDIKNSIKLNAS